MATDEEYLDNLLKSLTDSDDQEETQQLIEGIAEELLQTNTEETDPVVEESTGEWEKGLDELFAQAEEIGQEAPAGNSDEDFAEINELLNQDDKNEAVDDDMLALLESMGAEAEEEETEDAGELFDLFSDNALSEEESSLKEEAESKKSKKSKKKNKRSLFGKKAGKETKVQETDAEAQEAAEPFVEEVDFIIGGADGEIEENVNKSSKEKKPGFFSRMITLLTEEEEEPEDLKDVADGEIAEGAGEENKALSKKEAKKKKKEEKKKKKDKKGKEAESEGENSEAEGEEDVETEEDPKKKAKREKKERKKQERELQKQEKPVKVLSRKSMLVLIAACATIIAGVLALSTFLPDYADKKQARESFYVGDYETVYELLYDKHMNESDRLIFNRVETVLRIQRKIDSYNNNVAMNREVQAIDSLLQGIVIYQDIMETDEYGVKNEVDALYQEICAILESNYGITADEAIEINAYDNETYTKRIYSLVDGTEFVKPGEEIEPEEPLPPQDVLADEEEIISYE